MQPTSESRSNVRYPSAPWPPQLPAAAAADHRSTHTHSHPHPFLAPSSTHIRSTMQAAAASSSAPHSFGSSVPPRSARPSSPPVDLTDDADFAAQLQRQFDREADESRDERMARALAEEDGPQSVAMNTPGHLAKLALARALDAEAEARVGNADGSQLSYRNQKKKEARERREQGRRGAAAGIGHGRRKDASTMASKAFDRAARLARRGALRERDIRLEGERMREHNGGSAGPGAGNQFGLLEGMIEPSASEGDSQDDRDDRQQQRQDRSDRDGDRDFSMILADSDEQSSSESEIDEEDVRAARRSAGAAAASSHAAASVPAAAAASSSHVRATKPPAPITAPAIPPSSRKDVASAAQTAAAYLGIEHPASSGDDSDSDIEIVSFVPAAKRPSADDDDTPAAPPADDALYLAPPDPAFINPLAAVAPTSKPLRPYPRHLGDGGARVLAAAAAGTAPSSKKQKKLLRKALQLEADRQRLIAQQSGAPISSFAEAVAASSTAAAAVAAMTARPARRSKEQVYKEKHGKSQPFVADDATPFDPKLFFEPHELAELRSDWTSVRHVILLDLDNWSGFFRRLQYDFNDNVYLWVFHGANTHPRISRKHGPFLHLRSHGHIQFTKCGERPDAADFALMLKLGELNQLCAKSIPFTLFSGDRGFDETLVHIQDRRIQRVDPHHAGTDEETFALLKSIADT